MHSRVIESPQFGLILAKGRYQDLGRSHKIANYGSLGGDLEFLEFLGEIGFSKSLKKVLNRLFWMANLHFYGLEYGEGKKRAIYGSRVFSGKAGAAPQSIGCNREPAAGERYGEVFWVFLLIRITVTFFLGTGSELCPGYDVSLTKPDSTEM
jgi:hypothetical protein